MNNKLAVKLSGFHENYNTQYCLTYVLEKWKNTLDKGKHVGAVFMDLSKAFDTINHDLLIAKLEAYGFSTNALLLMLSYLKIDLKELALIAHSALGRKPLGSWCSTRIDPETLTLQYLPK